MSRSVSLTPQGIRVWRQRASDGFPSPPSPPGSPDSGNPSGSGSSLTGWRRIPSGSAQSPRTWTCHHSLKPSQKRWRASLTAESVRAKPWDRFWKNPYLSSPFYTLYELMSHLNPASYLLGILQYLSTLISINNKHIILFIKWDIIFF